MSCYSKHLRIFNNVPWNSCVRALEHSLGFVAGKFKTLLEALKGRVEHNLQCL